MEIPGKCFLTSGVGTGEYRLLSFEMALRNAGIHPFNLVRVSSIFPPNCELLPFDEGIKLLKEGAIVHLVLAVNSSNEKGRRINASIGLALPKNPDSFGYISEYESEDISQEESGKIAQKLAEEMLTSLKGKDAVLRSTHVTQSAVVEDGWTTVVAALVFI